MRARFPDPVVAIPDHILKGRGFTRQEVLLFWHEIAGERAGRLCVPVRLGRRPGGGVLVLRALPAALLELRYLAPQIIERYNAFMGYRAVGRIRFVGGAMRPPDPPPPPPPRALTGAERERLAGVLSGIPESPLRESLYTLGATLLREQAP